MTNHTSIVQTKRTLHDRWVDVTDEFLDWFEDRPSYQYYGIMGFFLMAGFLLISFAVHSVVCL